MCLKSVSYTHLDVYKRQTLGCALELSSMGIRVDADALARQLSIAGCGERAALPFHKMLLTDEPVSYTHLDVYKRQSQIMAITPEGVVKLEQQVYEEPILPRMDLTQPVSYTHLAQVQVQVPFSYWSS